MRVGGVGLRAEVQGLIVRLTSSGVSIQSDDPREAQTKVLWDKGLGRELGYDSFEAYLATIPDIPEDLRASSERFPELVLVDARPGLVKTCKLLGVSYSGDDRTFANFDPKKAKVEKVYWIRAQDGRKNSGKIVSVCRQQFTEDELGLTVIEGLALFAQNPKGLRNRAMDLPGSVGRGGRGYTTCPCLSWFHRRPELFWSCGEDDDPRYGSASRRV